LVINPGKIEDIIRPGKEIIIRSEKGKNQFYIIGMERGN